MESVKAFFKEYDFTVENHTSFDFSAIKKGSNFFFLKYTDFYFVETVSDLTTGTIESYHKKAKKEANSYFKIPKALRLSVPNINSVFLTKNPPQKVIDYVSTHKKNIVGGEQESIFIIDTTNHKMYSSGIDQTKITGEAKIIWGDKKEFKTLNGRNRAFYLMCALENHLQTSV